MSVKFWGAIRNFYKFSETTYDCEVAYKFENGITFCSNIKTEERDFLFPMNLTENLLT